MEKRRAYLLSRAVLPLVAALAKSAMLTAFLLGLQAMRLMAHHFGDRRLGVAQTFVVPVGAIVVVLVVVVTRHTGCVGPSVDLAWSNWAMTVGEIAPPDRMYPPRSSQWRWFATLPAAAAAVVAF